MKKSLRMRESCRWILPAALCLSLLVGCGGGGATPTQPPGGGSALTLEISATLRANGNFVRIIADEVLFDGTKIPTRHDCSEPPSIFGCPEDRLTANAESTLGAHKVAIRLLSHSIDLIQGVGRASYTCWGKVTVRTSSGVVQEISLPEKTVQLAPGDSVPYSIEVLP